MKSKSRNRAVPGVRGIRVTPVDVVLTLVLLCGSLLWAWRLYAAPRGGMTAEVYGNGRHLMTLDLDRNGTWPYEGAVIETRKNSVRIGSSDCPGQVCVHQGWVSSPGMSIICVPKKLMVRIQGAVGREAVDAIVR